MTITIHLLDEAEDALRDKADAAGLSLEQFARRTLEREIGLESGPMQPDNPEPEIPEFEMVTRTHTMREGSYEGVRRSPQSRPSSGSGKKSA